MQDKRKGKEEGLKRKVWGRRDTVMEEYGRREWEDEGNASMKERRR